MESTEITERDALTILREYAAKNGRFWKARLRDEWDQDCCHWDLRRLRNTIGPSGLARIRFSN